MRDPMDIRRECLDELLIQKAEIEAEIELKKEELEGVKNELRKFGLRFDSKRPGKR